MKRIYDKRILMVVILTSCCFLFISGCKTADTPVEVVAKAVLGDSRSLVLYRLRKAYPKAYLLEDFVLDYHYHAYEGFHLGPDHRGPLLLVGFADGKAVGFLKLSESYGVIYKKDKGYLPATRAEYENAKILVAKKGSLTARPSGGIHSGDLADFGYIFFKGEGEVFGREFLKRDFIILTVQRDWMDYDFGTLEVTGVYVTSSFGKAAVITKAGFTIEEFDDGISDDKYDFTLNASRVERDSAKRMKLSKEAVVDEDGVMHLRIYDK